jgi:hypothetical protein
MMWEKVTEVEEETDDWAQQRNLVEDLAVEIDECVWLWSKLVIASIWRRAW